MRIISPRSRGGQLVEHILCLGVLASVLWVAWFYSNKHYLPQPFIFNTYDTFMDWFNTAAFANTSGAYDVWHSVYPPLSFVFLDAVSVQSCYTNLLTPRDCDWLGIAAILISYSLAAILAIIAFWRSNPSTAIPRGLAFALGFPLLFCLERGNLILVCLTPFIIAYGNFAIAPFWRWLSIATTINFKPYLVLPSLALGVKREWRGLELAGLLTVTVYCVTLMIFGSGDPLTIYENAGIWVKFTSGQFYEQSYFSTSYATLLLVNESSFPILEYAPSQVVDTLTWLIPLIIRACQLAALAGVAAAWLQPRAVSLPRIAALLIGMHLVAQSPGGYALTFLSFLVFLEPDRRLGPAIALVCCYLLSLSYDVILATVIDTDLLSWLSGLAVQANFGLAAGQLIRPGLIMIVVWALALDTVMQVARAHAFFAPTFGLMSKIDEQTATLAQPRGAIA